MKIKDPLESFQLETKEKTTKVAQAGLRNGRTTFRKIVNSLAAVYSCRLQKCIRELFHKLLHKKEIESHRYLRKD